MILVYSFFAVIMIGALLLALPIASESGDFTSPIDAVFTATSAITGTGLVVVDTADAWSPFGEAVIAFLIFLGGLGFMTGAAFLLIIVGQRLGLQGQLLVGAGLGETRLGAIASLARNITIMAVAAQVIGAVFIFLRWYVAGPIWEGLSLGEAVWQSVFTSISAFNNSGFEIIPDRIVGGPSLVGFAGDIPTLTIIGVLILLGSTSYATLADVVVRRSWRRLRLDSKFVLLGIGVTLLIGFVSFMVAEWSNPGTIGNYDVGDKITQSVFHTVNRTSGFSTVDYGELHPSNLTVTEGLMFVGGASASTAAGIKVNTLMIIVFASISIFRGRGRTKAFGREIPRVIVQRAMTVGVSAAATVLVLIVALFAVQPGLDFRTGMFEVVSAFGTTGWSAGATPNLNPAARLVIAAAMFIGRFGPLTIALFMSGPERVDPYRYAQERVRVG